MLIPTSSTSPPPRAAPAWPPRRPLSPWPGRRADQQTGLPTAEQGWTYVDDLLDMLKLDIKHLNVNIFRARQHLARAIKPDVGALIERRSTTRQIRLGIAVEIVQP